MQCKGVIWLLQYVPCRGGKTPWSIQTWSHCHWVPELWTKPIEKQICRLSSDVYIVGIVNCLLFPMWVSVAIGFLHNHILTLNRLVHYLNPLCISAARQKNPQTSVFPPCRRVVDSGEWVCRAYTVCTCCRARGRGLWMGSRPASGPTQTPCLISPSTDTENGGWLTEPCGKLYSGEWKEDQWL